MNGETKGPRLGAEGLDDIGQDVGIILPPRTDSRPPRTKAGAARSPRSESSDSPAAVARLVASILDRPALEEERDLPRALQEIRRIRSAARRIREAGLQPGDEDALMGAVARRAAHAELAEWCLDAVILEIRGLSGERLDHSRALAHGRLRRARLEACPICLGRVLSETEIEDRKRREKWAAEDRARWEGLTR